ncbi:MAG: hypothetical protein JRJ03_15400 [Deltaproteobacteria bacterium]|nr:hypothetical protein [Deltaproteobacteria bacterium]
MDTMISQAEEDYILENAYVPEHGLALMVSLSGGEPFLIDKRFLALKNQEWVILVGYPLGGGFSLESLVEAIEQAKKMFNPSHLSIIAPQLPDFLKEASREREEDDYYTLDLKAYKLKSGLRRMVRKARALLTIDISHEITREHDEIIKEFVNRVKPLDRVKNLLFKMPQLLSHSDMAILLNAWDLRGRLTAFYAVDMQPRHFSTYVIGCHSKINYVPGASDLLCHEMIRLSEKKGKMYIHLGLGVDQGIRKFKEKWGGKPTLRYEMCEVLLKRPSILETLQRVIG